MGARVGGVRRAVAACPEKGAKFAPFSVDGLWGASGGDTDATDVTGFSEKSLKARVLGNFPNYRWHRCHRCHACAAPKKAPRRAWGRREARLAVRGAIIPNCDHARKVGERLSSMQSQRAVRDFNKRSLCTARSSEAQLMQRMRINQSNRVLKTPRSTVFDTAWRWGVCGAGVGRGRRRAVGRMWGAIRRAWWRMRAHEGVWWGARGARHRREWAAARVGEGSEGDCHQQRRRESSMLALS
jgi:hypothetical protein